MVIRLMLLVLFASTAAFSQAEKPATLKSTLLDQLNASHFVKDWYVPIDSAIAGLTVEQANWTDGKGNHSIAQLTTHLNYWNERSLQQMKGIKPPPYDGNNDETFAKVDAKTWSASVKKVDEILYEMEKFVDKADDATLAKVASTVQHTSAHNAYHVGQILYVRKLQGAWDPSKGVK